MLQRPQAVQETVQPQIQQIQQKPQSNKDNQQQQQMPQLQSAQELTQQSMQQRNKDVPEQQIQKRLQETREIPQQHREEYTLYHVQAKSNTQQKPQINKDIPQKQPMQQRRQLTHDNQQQQMPQLLSVQELTQQRNKDITEQQIQKRSQETREMPQQHREEYTLYHVQAEANTHKLQPVQETVLPQIQQRIHSNKDNQQQQISHTEHKISQRQMPQKQQSNKDNQQQPMPQTCEDILYQQQISHTLSEALQQFQINSNEEDQAETSSEQALEKLIEYCKNSKDITKLRHIYKILDEMKQQHETPQQEQPKQTELRQPKYWPYDLVRLNSNLVGTVINITETDDTIILQNNRIETVTEDKIVKKLSPQPKVIDCHKTQLFIGDRVKFNETKEGKIIQMYNKHLYVELPDNSFQCVPARLVESLSPKNRSCSVIGEKIIYIKGKHVYSKPLKITDVTTRKGLTVTDNRGNERSFPLELHGKKWVYENEFQSLLESGAL
ncbi:hypothetical protein GPJ56_010442 [Histomonas meleagridis]|uniref:uncharacterized protein n=1 Tax=Histomonas meleagridis TaxID=135588 RepID=UPI00355A50C8|nr:hypothetical protein GPJ56_010442 [Histomonas meleagridis]KAH0798999.1 hypothetical protein GO595_008151 [Histomonas meleagridis]